jgi:hypothetical protein
MNGWDNASATVAYTVALGRHPSSAVAWPEARFRRQVRYSMLGGV